MGVNMGGKAFSLLAIAVFSILIFIPLTDAAIFMGTVEGYVLDANSVKIPGASVNIVVSGCTGSGCSASTVTDSGGYYVVANLNIPAGGTVVVTANKFAASGSNSGVADTGYAAYVNVTLCPGPPTSLTAPVGSHDLNAVLTWITGFEISSQIPYDEYSFNFGPFTIETSPKVQLVPSYNTAYNWRVRTCNSVCCSSPNSSSVTIINTQPTKPILTDQPDTHNTSVTLCWTSGTDSDTSPTDVLHDEFYFDDDATPESGPIYSNISISPGSHCITFSNLTYSQIYYWRVKTCDGTGAPNECNWDTDSFTITNTAPSPPTLTDQGCATEDSVTLTWISGTDPEGDTTFDEFQFENATVVSPAASPYTQSGLISCEYYTWQVRTCDSLGLCSNWVTDDFNSCFAAVVAAPGIGGAGAAGVIQLPSYVASISAPLYINQGEEFEIFVNFKSDDDVESVDLEITGAPEFSFTSATIKDLDADTEKTVTIMSKVADDAEFGEYELLFTATKEGDEEEEEGEKEIISKHFKIIVTEIIVPVCGNGICDPGETFETCPADCPAIIVVPFAPAQFWILFVMVSAILLILWLLAALRRKVEDLVRYITKRIERRGEHTSTIRHKLRDLGWMDITLDAAFKKVKVQRALRQHIKELIKRGWSHRDIRRKLRRHGWGEELLEKLKLGTS